MNPLGTHQCRIWSGSTKARNTSVRGALSVVQPRVEILTAENLTSLDLSHNQVGPAGADALASSPHLANLVVLDLNGNPLQVKGLQALARSPHLSRIRTLRLAGITMDDTTRDELQTRFATAVKT